MKKTKHLPATFRLKLMLKLYIFGAGRDPKMPRKIYKLNAKPVAPLIEIPRRGHGLS